MTAAAPGIVLRRADSSDAPAIAHVYLAAFHARYDFPLAHSDDEVRGWVADHVVPLLETWVADPGTGVVAMMALDETGIDQLYVAPGWQGMGIGRRLVELAKQRRPVGLALYTFQVNAAARRFYERNGFAAETFGDGSGNEEHQPDVRYRWQP